MRTCVAEVSFTLCIKESLEDVYTKKNLITLCFATVFTLGLAACGGGGSGPAPMADNGDTDGDVSLVGRYIPSGFSLEGVDLPDGTTISVANGESVDVSDLVTAVCVSDDGCSATVAGGVLTIVGNLKIVSVNSALDDESVAQLAKVFPVMLPVPGVAAGISLDAMAVAGAIGPDADPAAVPDALMIANGVPGAKSPLEASDAVDAASIDGWTSSVTQRMTEAMGGIKASTDTVIIYNDQAARSRPMFSDRYTYDVDTDADNETDDALQIVATNVGLISGVEEFPSAALQTAVPFDANTNYAGMLDGAPGTFTCSGANCTLTTDADGKLSGVSTGNWYFIASEGATVDVDDYLRFGVWLNESTDDEGGPAYTAAAIYGGSADPASATAIQGVEGTASYSGSATGIYMRKTFAENGDPIPQEGGQFAADASLTANFSGDDVSANAEHTVTGMITNFMDGGNAIPGGWALELMAASFASDVYNANETTFTGRTRRDADTAADGDWTASFFGVSADDPKTDVVETDMPTGIAGEFAGHFNTGHVLGGFGAEMD